MNLTDAFTAWRISTPTAPGTHRHYGIAIRHMARHGITDVSHVTRERIGLYMLDRQVRDQVAPPTVNLELAALVSILSVQERTGLVDETLLLKLRRLRIRIRKNKRRRALYLTPEEFQRLVVCAPPRAILPMFVAAYSGLRIGELARLRRCDVDIERRVIDVSIVPELGDLGRIKTGCERQVPICEELVAAIRTHWPQIDEPGDRWDFLFPAPTGGPSGPWGFVQQQTLRRDLRLAVRRSGVTASYKLLRATRATWWAQDGVEPYVLAEWMGHTVTVCEQNYASVRPGYDPACETRRRRA